MARKITNNPKKAIKVISVELKIEIKGVPEVTYFGSKKAIFEYFGNKALGITYLSASQKDFKKGFENLYCIIREGTLFTLNSAEVREKREAEGREELPQRCPFIKR